MKKMLRIMLVWMFVISSLTSIGVSAAPEDPDAPDAVKVYMPFVVRQVTYNISGTVTDGNGSPLSGVTVTDKNGKIAVSNASGHYSLASPGGSNALTADKTGFEFAPGVLEINVAGDMTNQNFAVAAACIQSIVDPGFEAGGWWSLAGATYDNLNRNSGSWSALTGIPAGSPNNWGYSWVRTPLISVPVGTTSAILRMWVYAQTGESPLSPLPTRPIGQKFSAPVPDIDSTDEAAAISAYDAQYVMVLNGSNQILEILQWNRRNELFWMPRQFDLTKWAGQSVSIEVGTYNDGQGFTTNMYVDDVTLAMCDDPLPPPPVCSQQVANNSFEYFGNWIDDSDPTLPVIYRSTYDTYFANSGLRSLRVGTPLESWDDYAGYSEAYQVVSIPAGTTYARLSFYRLLRSEEAYIPGSIKDAELNSEDRIQLKSEIGIQSQSAADHLDFQYAYVTNIDGTALLKTLIFERGSNATNLVWKQNVYDLTAFAGQTLRIYFGVYNDGSIYRNRSVMYIDDVYLDTCTGVLPPPPPPPPPTTCVNLIGNGGFQTNADWYIPATAYSAGYTNVVSRSGGRAMRTGIFYPSQNRYSYSDFAQYVYIPPTYGLGATALLEFYEYTAGGDGGNDIQYLLVLDYWGNWIDTLRWGSRGQYQWVYHNNDLTSYGDWLIRLQWGTYNNGWGAVTSMTIDDVSLRYCP